MNSYSVCNFLAKENPPGVNTESRIIDVLKNWNTCPIEDIKFVKNELSIPENYPCRPGADDGSLLIIRCPDNMEVFLYWQLDNYRRAFIING